MEKIKLSDLAALAGTTRVFYNWVRSWQVVNDLPLKNWMNMCDKGYGYHKLQEVLEGRKSKDVRKFREGAKASLLDLNRSLASLGLGQINLEDIEI